MADVRYRDCRRLAVRAEQRARFLVADRGRQGRDRPGGVAEVLGPHPERRHLTPAGLHGLGPGRAQFHGGREEQRLLRHPGLQVAAAQLVVEQPLVGRVLVDDDELAVLFAEQVEGEQLAPV